MKPAWERAADRKWKEHLKEIRAVYGKRGQRPTPRQRAIMRRLWRTHQLRRFMDYARKYGLDIKGFLCEGES